ncbi:MAG: hypothetical protein SWH61_07330 [Thermodesulfobacteriota bacterium]|nr:hypothetical protein [Thermodesulfobacteriota bacterium]
MKEADRKKRNAAIAAAVMNYIKSEAEIAAVNGLVAANKGNSPLERGPFVCKNTWGADARHSQMQNRTMMQMRAFNRK